MKNNKKFFSAFALISVFAASSFSGCSSKENEQSQISENIEESTSIETTTSQITTEAETTELKNGDVSGDVVDASGNGISEVDVVFEEIGTKTVNKVVTDQNGHFESSLLPGKYNIAITAEGYEDYYSSDPIEIISGDKITLDDEIKLMIDVKSIYADVLDDFYYQISTNWKYLSESDHGYIPDDFEVIVEFYLRDKGSDEIGFQYIDLNDDNQDELVIVAKGFPDDHYQLCALYSIVDGQCVDPIDYMLFQGNLNLSLSMDKTICFHGGAAIYEYEYLKLKQGELIPIVKYLEDVYDYTKQNGTGTLTYYRADWSDESGYSEFFEITEDEFTNSKKDVFEYDLTSFSQYTPTSDQPASKTEDWKIAYVDHLDEMKLNYQEDNYTLQNASFYFVDVNGDNIPEIHFQSGSGAGGSSLMTYDPLTGNVNEIHSGNGSWVELIEGSNSFDYSGGHMGYYYDIVYKIEDGNFTEVAHGEWNDTGNRDFEEYIYYWNDEEVTETEYKTNLNDLTNVDNADHIFETHTEYKWYQINQAILDY